MYSNGKVAVDKGLGFDFSQINDLIKTALPVGLNIFNKQMELKQIKAMTQPGYVPVPTLPFAQPMATYSTFGQPVQPSSGMSNTTMALIGISALVVGLVAFKALK